MLLSLAAAMLCGVPFDVQGDTVQVVRSTPFTVVAKQPGDLYFWSLPSTWKATEEGDRVTVTSCPVGEATLRVRIVRVDWEQHRMTQEAGEIKILVGILPGPGPDPGPTPPNPAGCDGKPEGLARDVCGWVDTVPEASRGVRADLAKVFAQLADGLESGKWINYSQSNAWFLAERDRVLGTQQLKDDWLKFGSRVAAALAPLGNAPRAEVVKFYRGIAEGLR